MTTPKKKPIVLTEREEAMLALLATGKKNRDIGDALGLSEGTTRVYLHYLYERIGVANKTEAAIWFDRRRAAIQGAVEAPTDATVGRVTSAFAQLDQARERIATVRDQIAEELKTLKRQERHVDKEGQVAYRIAIQHIERHLKGLQ